MLSSVLALGKGETESSVTWLIVIQLINLAVYGYLHFKRIWIQYICYFAVIGSILSSFSSITQTPSVANTFSIFYLLILAMIFNEIMANDY